MKQDKPLVAIKCLVYNHEPYLRDCLEGFVMQQTNFPFVAIVHDDASTDNSAAIIREYEEKYPDIIKPIYEAENQYSKRDGSLGRIMNAAVDAIGAKYVAMCEGDDYWTDPLKLQKQVDFMETNPEYGLCYAKAYRYNEELKKYIGVKGSARAEVYELSIQGTHHISTPTILMRQSLFLNCLSDSSFLLNNGLFTDSSLWWWFAANSKLYFMDDVVAVYRELSESASHSKDINIVKDRIRKALKVKLFFLLKYPIQNKVYLESVIEDYLLYVDNYAQYHGFVIGDKIRKSKRYLLGQKVYNFIKKIKLC